MNAGDISILLAFAAGLLSFGSPCVLPLVPAFVSHLTGVSVQEASAGRQRALMFVHAACFVLGFSLVFICLWVSIGLIGYAVRGYSGLLRIIGGSVLVILGLHTLGAFRLPLLMMEHRPQVDPLARRGLGTSFVIGVFFAAGWTPCIGSVLAGIIGLATLSDTVWHGAYLLAAYSAGLGLPFLAAALALGWVTSRLRGLRGHFRVVSLLSGAFIAGVGVLMLTNTFQRLPQYFTWAAF